MAIAGALSSCVVKLSIYKRNVKNCPRSLKDPAILLLRAVTLPVSEGVETLRNWEEQDLEL